MKYIKSLPLALIFSVCLIQSGCKKDDKATEPETAAPVVTPPVTITSSTVFTDNTVGYLGGSLNNANIRFFGVQGDSAGYSIEADAPTFILIKTYSPNFPATPPVVGTYNIYNLNNMCDTCAHPLLPNEAIMLCGDVVTSGTVNVTKSGGKYTYTFTNITVANTTNKWSGKLVSP